MMTAVSVTRLEEALERYDEALKSKGKEDLVESDRWFRGELRDAVRQRHRSKAGAHLTHEEMVKLIKWKLRRGKFRPALEGYVRSNPDDLVFSSTKAALTLLFDAAKDDAPDEETIRHAMKAACQMKGVGPGLSSALLVLAMPTSLPYMSDELFAFGVGMSSTPKYTEKEYVNLFHALTERLSQERSEGKDERKMACLQDAEQFEKATWAYGILSSKGLLDRAETSSMKREREHAQDASTSTTKRKKRRR